MLSYQHGYHAASPADIIKHLVLHAILQSLLRKETPFHVFDTHAGAGIYNLLDREGQKTLEYRAGLDRVLSFHEGSTIRTPALVVEWLNRLQEWRNQMALPHGYPGSPEWIRMSLRPQDRATFWELHPAEFQKLQAWRQGDRRLLLHKNDAFTGLKAFLPPLARRGLILIDPSYELITDYQAVVNLLKDGLKRFANGVYAIWYPVVERGFAQQMVKAIEALQVPKTLQVEIDLMPQRIGLGVQATGLIILNAPWQLDTLMQETVPWLSTVFASGKSAILPNQIRWLVGE